MPSVINTFSSNVAPEILGRAALDVLTSALISRVDGVVHGVTKRVPGLGKADGNVGYSAPRDREDAWDMRTQWLASAGLEAEQLVVTHQTHGNAVTSVTAANAGRGARPGSSPLANSDALVTNETGVVLLTLHADCMPVLLCDPVNRAVASIHAGWRGTVADVCGETIRAMKDHFGTDPEKIIAFLGPAIGSCCYEVGADVREAWISSCADPDSYAVQTRTGNFVFDLEVSNRMLLERAGLDPVRIESCGICTRCSGDEWFSHRGQGANTGRYGAFISLTGYTTGGA
jgi:YfiH family protein